MSINFFCVIHVLKISDAVTQYMYLNWNCTNYGITLESKLFNYQINFVNTLTVCYCHFS